VKRGWRGGLLITSAGAAGDRPSFGGRCEDGVCSAFPPTPVRRGFIAFSLLSGNVRAHSSPEGGGDPCTLQNYSQVIYLSMCHRAPSYGVNR
jgi:hypothetical protein